MKHARLASLSFSAALLFAGAAGAADDATRCDASKLKAAGKYANCRLKTEAAALLKGIAPDYSVCESKFSNAYVAIEEDYGDACPLGGESSEVAEVLNTCTATVSPTDYDVTFSMTSASGQMGALQFEVDYSSNTGEFVGDELEVQCTNLISGALFAKHDYEADEELVLGFIPNEPKSAPLHLASCVFRSIGYPDPDGFLINVTDATNAGGFPINVVVEVFAISPH